MENPYHLIHSIFNGVYLDTTSLFTYDYFNDLIEHRLGKYINIFIEKEIDYESFLDMKDEDINILDIPIGPKVAIRSLIKKLKKKEMINKLNSNDYLYLKEFDKYEDLKKYKYFFLERQINFNVFINLTEIHLKIFDIPIGHFVIIRQIIRYLRSI